MGIPVDRRLDTNDTGLIGVEYTDITTTLGSLAAKRTSTNPAFAAVVVDMLDRAGVRRGDAVAVSFSGSFPALNIAVLSAARALDLRPVIISSVGSSTYGANQPEMTWLDMERVLAEAGLFPYRSIAASLGGIAGSRGRPGRDGHRGGPQGDPPQRDPPDRGGGEFHVDRRCPEPAGAVRPGPRRAKAGGLHQRGRIADLRGRRPGGPPHPDGSAEKGSRGAQPGTGDHLPHGRTGRAGHPPAGDQVDRRPVRDSRRSLSLAGGNVPVDPRDGQVLRAAGGRRPGPDDRAPGLPEKSGSGHAAGGSRPVPD